MIRAVGILVQEHHADVGVGEDVAAHPQRREVGGRAAVLLALLDVERADRPVADASGEARPGQQRNGIARRRQADLPAEEEDHVLRRVLAPAATTAAATTAAGVARAELEHAGVLEEEIALLGEEQVEARQVDLLLVGFDLREVGVDGEVPRQARRHAVLHVEAGVVVAIERHVRQLVEVRERVRLDANVRARPQALQPFDRARPSTRATAGGCAAAATSSCFRSCGADGAES